MSFHRRLTDASRAEWDAFFALPFVRRAVLGDLSRADYLAFLGQAYHHVKHTVPLLMAAGARVPDRLGWLRAGIADYVAEEIGHEQWILDDIAAAGGDADAVRAARPGFACELLVAYAYDGIERGNPASMLGMVHVLEGASVRGATRAGTNLQQRLGLEDGAVRYLRSHGALDEGHVDFFAGLCDRLDDPADQECVLHASRAFFRLYGDVFRELEARA